MRFIFKLALGMIIFNSMIILLADFFPNADSGSAKDVTADEDISVYQGLSKSVIVDAILSFVGIFGASVLFSGLAAKLLNLTIPLGPFLGAGIVISLFLTLWTGYTSILLNISEDLGLANWYYMFMILFGVILMLSVAEIFTGKGDIDA